MIEKVTLFDLDIKEETRQFLVDRADEKDISVSQVLDEIIEEWKKVLAVADSLDYPLYDYVDVVSIKIGEADARVDKLLEKLRVARL